MILKGDFLVIHDLYKQGTSIRKIARMLEIDRKTVRRALQQPKQIAIERSINTESKLEPYKKYVLEFIGKSSERIPYSVLLEDIADMGYTGSRSILQHFLTKAYKARKIDNDPIVRFETAPGMQMQVDWTTIRSGKNPIYAFVAVLGYSRNTFVYFVDNMEADNLVMCHEKAFLFFGGTTKTILYDNMKAVVTKRDCYGEGKHKFHDKLYDLSKKCKFEIILCKPYRAKTKGKVERFNSYLKGNFYRPIVIKLKDSNLTVTPQILNERSSKWLIKANNRVHGTTKKIPYKIFMEEELKHLIPYMSQVSINSTTLDNINTTQLPNKPKELPYTVVQKPQLAQYDQLLVGAVA